jgi:hypothetical protein
MRLAASFGCLMHPEIHNRIDNLNNRFFVHHFRIYKRSDIDSRFREYMKLAYEVGSAGTSTGQKHSSGAAGDRSNAATIELPLASNPSAQCVLHRRIYVDCESVEQRN